MKVAGSKEADITRYLATVRRCAMMPVAFDAGVLSPEGLY